MCKRHPDTLKQAISSTRLRGLLRKTSRAKPLFPWRLMRRLGRCSLAALPQGMAIRTPLGKHTNDTLTWEPVLRLRCEKWPVSSFTL